MTELASAGVGEALARARQTQGLALADVAQLLKFAPRQLEALEQERFEALPGATFARGMVRSYARLLKLDPEPLLRRIAGRFSPVDSGQLAARYSQPVPFSDGGRHATLLYLALSAGVLALVGVVAYGWHREDSAPQAGISESAGSQPVRVPLAAPSASTPAAEAETSAITVAAPLASSAEETPASSISPPPSKDPVPVRSAGNRIVLACDQEAWIEVRDAEDSLLLSSLNPAGSERVVQGKGPFSLVIGNAQNVRVSYNDRPVDLAPHTKVEVARFTLK